MEVIRAFTNNSFSTPIMIRGTHEKPLFRARDVGVVLEIQSVKTSLREFDNTEKVVESVVTAGGPQEMTFLTEHGLYRLLNNSRKPIARQFRVWVYDVIHTIRMEGQYKLQEELAETKRQLTATTVKLDAATTKLEERRVMKFDMKDRVYIVEDTNDRGEPVFKFGKSADMTSRMKTYKSSRYNDGYRDCVVCSNGKALEDLVHNVLRGHADVHRKDWIFVPYEVMKATLEMCRDFVDRMISPRMTFDDILERVRSVKAAMAVDDIRPTVEQDVPNTDEEGPDTRTPQQCVDQFFKEQVIVNEASICAVTDISATYRIWRGVAASKEEWKLFYAYIRTYFKKCRTYDTELSRNQQSFRGIELKPFEYYKPVPRSDDDDDEDSPENPYDAFIRDMCIVGVNKRIPTSKLLDAVIKWKKEHGHAVGIPDRERRRLQAHLRATGFVVMMSTFHDCAKEGGATGVVDEIGAYGIALKECPHDHERHIGQSVNKRKPVYEIDTATDTVVKVYDSMSIASFELKTDAYYRVKTGSVIDGRRLSYAPPDPNNPWIAPPQKRMGRRARTATIDV